MKQKDKKDKRDKRSKKRIEGARQIKRYRNPNLSVWFGPILACLAAFGLFYSSSVLAATDLLADLMPLLRATFGPGSVTVKAFYLLVIGIGVWRYHVTGNLAPVASIVIVVLVVTFGMSHLVFN